MNFSSDNAYGADPRVLAALAEANEGAASPYGDDPWTEKLREAMNRLFEREVATYPIVTGTAANALALATLCPQHGAILCHAEAHIAADECGAPEFFTHGAKLVPLEGEGAKLTPDTIEQALKRFKKGFVQHAQPAVISLAQTTERGTVYTPDEIAAIAAIARQHDLKLHMDGARFANALAHLGCSASQATWRAGIAALSFGSTKNGALGAEAVVFFDPDDARDFEYRRKKGGHLISKMRFVSAQMLALLQDGHWLTIASRANGLAKRAAQELKAIPGVEIAHPVEANAVFARFPDAMLVRLRRAGMHFHDWSPSEDGKTLVRLMFSFATPDADLEQFLSIARG